MDTEGLLVTESKCRQKLQAIRATVIFWPHEVLRMVQCKLVIILHPLPSQLQQDTCWKWSTDCEKLQRLSCFSRVDASLPLEWLKL